MAFGSSAARDAERHSIFGPFVLSYLVGAALLAALVHVGGLWNILANTRLLDVLVRIGAVALTDADAGFIAGVPHLSYYRASQDAVDWGMLLVAALLFVLFWAVKSLQFHDIARACGIDGRYGNHARAYLYGLGVNRLLPYNIGNVTTATALRSEGASAHQAASAVFLGELMVVFEIVAFALIGLWLVGLTSWLSMIFWGVVIAAVAWFLISPARVRGVRRGAGYGRAARQVGEALSEHPVLAARLAVLSVVAFALEDLIAWIITQAFTSQNVIMHVEPSLILMALVAGYIARFFPFTPGGIGQFEWAFAAALYLGGVGLPEAVTIAILDNVMRYVVGTLVLGGISMRSGTRGELGRSIRAAAAPPPAPAAVAVAGDVVP